MKRTCPICSIELPLTPNRDGDVLTEHLVEVHSIGDRQTIEMAAMKVPGIESMTAIEWHRLNRLRIIYVGRAENSREVFNRTGNSFYSGAAVAYDSAAREIQMLLDTNS